MIDLLEVTGIIRIFISLRNYNRALAQEILDGHQTSMLLSAILNKWLKLKYLSLSIV